VLYDGARPYVFGQGLAYSYKQANHLREWMHPDTLGSSRAQSDYQGSVIQTQRSDEFGVLIAQTESYQTQYPLGYTGEFRDAATGFTFLRARMYEPSIGRFLQRDRGIGGYAYADNNPTRFTDPSGNEPYEPNGASCDVVNCSAQPGDLPPGLVKIVIQRGTASSVITSYPCARGSQGCLP
jgi:RHS repeat-associated protein